MLSVSYTHLKNNFTQKLKELYILLEQNDLTTAQKILGEQIPLKDTDIICCTNSIVAVSYTHLMEKKIWFTLMTIHAQAQGIASP